jgi:hypothetical protein
MVVVVGRSPDRCRKQKNRNDSENDCTYQTTLVITSLLSFSDIAITDVLWGRSIDRLIDLTTFTLIGHGHKPIRITSTHDDLQLSSGIAAAKQVRLIVCVQFLLTGELCK